MRLSFREEHEKELDKLKDELEREKQNLQKEKDKNKDLQSVIDGNEAKNELAVMRAVQKVEEEKRKVESEMAGQKERYKILLDEKDKTIELYKYMKTRMSTKMVGESLEQHCQVEFNRIRMTAFPNAYFEKDNDARTGSKGDFIFRETDENGTELISIMFEMKNEADETATKHRNEDFFKELDKDRREKKCEYAVLVSLLESDSDLYNGGIVDVSYVFPKMYVVRPQCFIPIITLLRNAAMNAMQYKQELAIAKSQNVDVTNFEEKLVAFKDAFSKNYDSAHTHFDKVITEIDKSIARLEAVKKELLVTGNQLRFANDKVEGLTVKKLTHGNPTMKKKFEDARKEREKLESDG